jgi:hypothetical protein
MDIRRHSPVVLNLHSPREKVWGILMSMSGAGVSIRGIDLDSFEDWTRSVARGERTMGLSTTFFPMHRVERINLDERVGEIPSCAENFESRVGKDVWLFLGLDRPAPEPE